MYDNVVFITAVSLFLVNFTALYFMFAAELFCSKEGKSFSQYIKFLVAINFKKS